MLTVSNEYGIYLYSEKVDMRKGIDGLCGIVRSQMGLSPFKSKSIFVFGGKNPRAKKVLIQPIVARDGIICGNWSQFKRDSAPVFFLDTPA